MDLTEPEVKQKTGFRVVFEFGLPLLISETELSDDAMIKSFLAIAANNDDTNILYRSNPEVLYSFKKLCQEALKSSHLQSYSAVIEYCKKENISPGGSADLLAVTIFVWSIINADITGFTKTF